MPIYSEISLSCRQARVQNYILYQASSRERDNIPLSHPEFGCLGKEGGVKEVEVSSGN